MKEIGRGIATAGIWIGIRICSFNISDSENLAIISMFGMGATAFVWGFHNFLIKFFS